MVNGFPWKSRPGTRSFYQPTAETVSRSETRSIRCTSHLRYWPLSTKINEFSEEAAFVFGYHESVI
jgi:hypothetical protein